MSEFEVESDVNVEELRSQLAGLLALLLMLTGVLLLWLSLLQDSVLIMLGLLAVVGFGRGVRKLVETRPDLARHLLMWGVTAGLLIGMGVFSEPWLPFLGPMLVFVSAVLVPGGECATAGAVAALAMGLTVCGVRAYPLLGLLIALAVGVAAARMVVRTLYTALGWTSTMQQRADHLLELARDRQGELSKTLKSLDSANAILRRTQRELIVARKQAEEARLMKEQFAANISHELRTPLNLILGFSEVMYLSPEVYGDMAWSPALRRDIYQVYRSSRHLLELIDDVLDLSRFEMVGFTLNKEPTPLEPLLRDTARIVEDFFRGRPVALEVEIAPNLPTLEVDRTRIRQVLLNLLNNAQRFTEEGAVRVAAKRADGEVMVSVSDTGPGVPADKLPHLFDEFYQIDRSLHRKHGGAGLGLAISKRFVEAHDGRIWVESREGLGSTFTFTLPIPGEHVPVSHLRASRPLEPSGPEPRSPILVLDADPAVSALVDRHLEEYDVVPVEEAGQLAEQVTLHHPQAVVCNVPPGGHGVCDIVVESGAIAGSVPLIECSLPSQAWVADDLAVTACLTKPVAARQLLREIERLGGVRDVLIVDDDRGFCELVERMLEAGGRSLEVRQAYCGEDGLQALRARRPDLLLLDLIMPGVDGFRVLEEMRRDPDLVDVPVVLLTATSFAEDALEQRGARVVIQRPDGLAPAEVLRCLQAVIGVLSPHYDERSFPGEPLFPLQREGAGGITPPPTAAARSEHRPD